jgi:uncharacterized protein involved in exopolysaccharide biosynthesis
VLCIIGVVAGYAFTFLLPIKYTASALVLVRPQQPIKIGTTKEEKEYLDFPMGSASTVETPAKTYIEIIKSPELIGKVVDKLGLDKEEAASSGKTTTIMPAFMKSFVNDLKQRLTMLKYGKKIEDDPVDKAVKEVQDNLTLTSHADTYVFEIKYEASDSRRAATVADTTASVFIDFMEQIRQSETQHIRDQLKIELEQNRKQLDVARQRLEDYKKLHSVFLYESEYDAKLRVISELEVELVKAEEALAAGQSTLATASLAAKKARLMRSISEQKAELSPLPDLERQFKQLDQDVKDALTAYEIVQREFKEADIKYSYATPDVRLVSQAVPPPLPSSPRRATLALASLLGGLVVGVGLSFLLEYLNPQVRGVRDIEDFVGVKVLATIPRISRRRWRHAGLS